MAHLSKIHFYRNIKTLLNSGKIERTARGVYILPEIWEDEFVNLQARFRKGIFSNETALFLLDLTDRTPNRFDMTFTETYNLTNVKKEQIIALTIKGWAVNEDVLSISKQLMEQNKEAYEVLAK